MVEDLGQSPRTGLGCATAFPGRRLVEKLSPDTVLNLHISQCVSYSEHLISSTTAPLWLLFPGTLGDWEDSPNTVVS